MNNNDNPSIVYSDAQDNPETWTPIPRNETSVPIERARSRNRARISFRRTDNPDARADVRLDRFGLTVLLSRPALPGEPASARVGVFLHRQVIVVIGDPGEWVLGGYNFWPPTTNDAADLVTEWLTGSTEPVFENIPTLDHRA